MKKKIIIPTSLVLAIAITLACCLAFRPKKNNTLALTPDITESVSMAVSFTCPIDGDYIFITEYSEDDKAVTLGTKTDTTIIAPLDGKIEIANETVTITNGRIKATLYNVKNIQCDNGEYVQGGRQIGIVGDNVFANRHLLRIELIENGIKVDPTDYLNLVQK